jgi:hypothetical protein
MGQTGITLMLMANSSRFNRRANGASSFALLHCGGPQPQRSQTIGRSDGSWRIMAVE